MANKKRTMVSLFVEDQKRLKLEAAKRELTLTELMTEVVKYLESGGKLDSGK